MALSRDDYADALQAIPPNVGRDLWVRAGMAARAAGLSEADFLQWSEPAESFNERDARAAWKSFRGDGVTAGTLVHMAKDFGWEPPQKHFTPAEIWDAAAPATVAHPYIARKNGPPDGLRVLPAHHPLVIKGVGCGGALVVPAFDLAGKLQTVQLIGAQKLNLPGAKFEDGMFLIGTPTSPAPVFVCEGWGTAAACWRATGHCTAVTFGVGRFRRVARALRQRFPGSPLVLVPDRGVEVDVGKAARELGVQMVCLPPDMPLKSDAADYAQQRGDEELECLLARPSTPADEREAPGGEVIGADHIQEAPAVKLTDFRAYSPAHNYLFVPTRELWPASSVNARVPWPKDANGKDVAPAAWLDKHRSIEQMAWHPAEPELIRDRVLQVSGWVAHAGATVFNLYRPPALLAGDASKASTWIDHVKKVYPDEAAHIVSWLAQRVQRPGEKVNHALVLGGEQGVGKDTILEPVKAAIGPWNWQDITPGQMLGRFNPWAKAVVTRVSEARDLGDVDRFAFYDHSKVYIAAPPDVIRVDEKHLREHYVANVMGVVITTNHKSDGIYLPADDRRHFVAWSPRTREDFHERYWTDLYHWLGTGGTGHVCEYLRGLDLSSFDPKAPPPKTPAFWSIVAASEAPESGELRDVVESMGYPSAVTLSRIVEHANMLGMGGLVEELTDRKLRRTLPFKLERVGLVAVRNPDAEDGLFKVAGSRKVIYAAKTLSFADQVRAARKVTS